MNKTINDCYNQHNCRYKDNDDQKQVHNDYMFGNEMIYMVELVYMCDIL